MSPDTPLAEVVQLLTAEGAGLLLQHPPFVQQYALETLRALVVFWEARGVMLDPIQFGAVSTGVIVQAIDSLRMAQQFEMRGRQHGSS